MTPRSLEEASMRPKETSYPYLNAPRGRDIGYKSCTWRDDDRFMAQVVLVVIICSFIGLAFLIGGMV